MTCRRGVATSTLWKLNVTYTSYLLIINFGTYGKLMLLTNYGKFGIYDSWLWLVVVQLWQLIIYGNLLELRLLTY